MQGWEVAGRRRQPPMRGGVATQFSLQGRRRAAQLTRDSWSACSLAAVHCFRSPTGSRKAVLRQPACAVAGHVLAAVGHHFGRSPHGHLLPADGAALAIAGHGARLAARQVARAGAEGTKGALQLGHAEEEGGHATLSRRDVSEGGDDKIVEPCPN